MYEPFRFQYGESVVECYVRGDDLGAEASPATGMHPYWYYRVNGGPEQRGPVAHPSDSQFSVAFVVKKLYAECRDPAEPVAGRALYRLAPGLVNMEPHPSRREWLQPSKCFEGYPDESTRSPKGVYIVLHNLDDPAGEPAAVWSSHLRRVEREDCG